MKTSIWVVTSEVNQYDQEGSYFVGVFIGKPDFNKLKILLPNESDTTIGKLSRGGGRQDSEHVWYWLEEVKENKNYFTEAD